MRVVFIQPVIYETSVTMFTSTCNVTVYKVTLKIVIVLSSFAESVHIVDRIPTYDEI